MISNFQLMSESQNGKRRKRLPWRFGSETGDQNHVGLLPTGGWRERNLRFINDVLIPHILAPRLPGGDAALLAHLDLEQIGVTWLGHAGFLVQIGGQNVLVDPNWALWHGPVKR